MNRISIIIMMYQCINWIRILLEILVTLSIAITACSVLHNLCNIIACTSRFESDISFSASLRIQIDLWLPGRLGKTQFEIFSADFIVDTRGGRRENPPLSTLLDSRPDFLGRFLINLQCSWGPDTWIVFGTVQLWCKLGTNRLLFTFYTMHHVLTNI